MPVCKWKVEPIELVCRDHLSRANHRPRDFTEVSNEICSNIIRQISSLSRHAQDLFRELSSQATDISVRSVRLCSKVTSLKEKSNQLNPTVDKVSLDDIILCKPFKSGLQRHVQGMGRPEAVTEAYSKLEPIPDLHLLNTFKSENEVDCSKLYSDPNFFFLSWCGQIKQEVDKKPTRKKAPAKKKAEVTRKPQNVNLRKIQDRMKNEIMGGASKTSREQQGVEVGVGRGDTTKEYPRRQNEDDTTDEQPKEKSTLMPDPLKASISSNIDRNIEPIALEESSTNQNMFPPPPLMDAIGDQSNSADKTTDSIDNGCSNKINNNNNDDDDGDFSLPPPPAMDLQKRGTLYLVEDFSPDFQVLPAPPPLDMFQALNSSRADEQPHVPLPPPLPVISDGQQLQRQQQQQLGQQQQQQQQTKSFSDAIANNAFGLKSVTSTPVKCASIDRQSSSGKESRNDLLSAIRHGIKLRKVDEVRQETKDQGQDGVAGMFDVQMILEMRRRAMQDDDDDDEDEYDSECSWDD